MYFYNKPNEEEFQEMVDQVTTIHGKDVAKEILKKKGHILTLLSLFSNIPYILEKADKKTRVESDESIKRFLDILKKANYSETQEIINYVAYLHGKTEYIKNKSRKNDYNRREFIPYNPYESETAKKLRGKSDNLNPLQDALKNLR